MGLISRLKGAGDLLLFHDYRSGSFQDLSGNGNHGDPTGFTLGKRAMRCDSGGGGNVLLNPDPVVADAGAMVFHCKANGAGQNNGGRLFESGSLRMYTDASQRIIYGFSSIVVGTSGFFQFGFDHVVILTWDAAGLATLYVDGVADGGPVSIGAPAGSANARIGNRPVTNRQFYGKIYSCLYASRELTPTEVAQLTTQLQTEQPDDRQILLGHDDAGDLELSASGQGARETTVDLTAGYLPGTPFQISTGTWKVVSEVVNGKTAKVIECVGAGIAYLPMSSLRQNELEAAYGSWEFLVNKAGGSVMNAAFIAQAGDVLTAGDFLFEFDASENLAIVKQGTGDVIAGGTASASTWHAVKVTRSPGGSFELFIDDSSEGTGSDAASVSAGFFTIDLDAGDKIALVSRDGEPLFRKWIGVI